MRHRRSAATFPAALLVFIAALLVGASGCSGSSESGSPTTTKPSDTTTSTTAPTVAEAYTGDDFFTPPDPLPAGPHGTLIRYQEAPGFQLEGTTTYRIMYLSESLQGDPISVTGFASVPTKEAPPEGRPMITITHGTTGIADECAPSVTGQNSEMSLVGSVMAEDFLIAATDYEGLGSPGRHPYLVGESEGRSGIDAILAAGELPDAHPGTQLAIAGYSQGGHAAIWTNQVAAEWAPDLEVVGTFSGAPASEIGVIIAAAARVKGFGAMTIAGINAAYPDADLAEVLSPEGIELLDVVDEGCAPQTFAAFGEVDGADVFLSPGGTVGRWNELANAQNAGTEKTNDAPVLVIHSDGDGTVPTFFIDQVVNRMCANGQVVERIDLADGGGHTEAAIPAYQQGLEWLQARFADDGAPVENSCPA